MTNILPEPTLRRLPWYLSYLKTLQAEGVTNVSSTSISRAVAVESSQIAKDLSFLNIRGKTRIGYDVAELVATLSDFLGFDRMHRAVVVGVGSLGGALIRDKGLTGYGLNIVAGFDTDPEIIGAELCDVPVYSIDELKRRASEAGASIGILTVPASVAQNMADAMVAAGLTAVWNFTPFRVRVREGIVVSNTSIYANLALIYNRLAHGANFSEE